MKSNFSFLKNYFKHKLQLQVKKEDQINKVLMIYGKEVKDKMNDMSLDQLELITKYGMEGYRIDDAIQMSKNYLDGLSRLINLGIGISHLEAMEILDTIDCYTQN